MDQSAGSLSGGQQQMLAVARAFLAEPSVAVLDEVSMGLAPKVIDHIYAGLRKLTASGIALLLVEQYVARALEMADRVVLLDRGTVSFDGPASALDEGTIISSYLHTASADPDSSAAKSLPADKSLSHQETLPHEKTLC
jgi:branched-chain amino acid transport system ATP-binding protein